MTTQEAGIYKIINIINNKEYIGSSCNLQKRKNNHFLLLRKNKHHSKKLQNAYNKYGVDNFVFEILEICDKEQCIEREQYYIDLYEVYKKGYNMANIAGRPSHSNSKESIQKGIQTRIKNNSFVLTKEHKENISKSLKNSQPFRENHLKGREKVKRIIYQYDEKGNFLNTFKGLEDASLKTNIYKGLIAKVLSKRQTHTHGFLFSYFDNFKQAFFKKEKVKSKVKYVDMYDLENNFIKRFNSSKEYGLEYNYKSDQISRYIKKGSTFKGYKLFYGEQH